MSTASPHVARRQTLELFGLANHSVYRRLEPLSRAELYWLTVHLVRFRALRRVAMQNGIEACFGDMAEFGMEAVIRAAATIGENSGRVSWRHLTEEVARRAPPNPGHPLFDDLWGRGQLMASLSQCAEDDLSEEYGWTLLRRFLHERLVLRPLRSIMHDAGNRSYPNEIDEVLQAASRIRREIDAIGRQARHIQPIGSEIPELEQRLAMHRGRSIVGLRTGFPFIDERLCGMRGLVVLAAAPGVGKTALCLQVAAGVCRHHAENDAVVVFVSLDMDRWELYTRLISHLARVDWATLTLGSPELRGRAEGPWLTQEHQAQIEDAMRRMDADQVASRLRICDRSQLGPTFSAEQLASVMAEAKVHSNARRGLLILDYLNIVDVPEQGPRAADALEMDKQRVRFAQELRALTMTTENPDGDAVLVIAESRKPGSKNETWGSDLQDIMGSARLPYAVDAALMYRRMKSEDIRQHYRVQGGEGVTERVRLLKRNSRKGELPPASSSWLKGGTACAGANAVLSSIFGDRLFE